MASQPWSRRSVVLLVIGLALCLRLAEWWLTGSLDPSLTSSQNCGKNNQKHGSTIIQQESSTTTTPRPHNLRLVLIGDSLTRYTYLSLVYFLHTGHWYDPNQVTPHLVQSSSFASLFHNQTWMEFAWQTNRLLFPNEICDCYRKLPGRLNVNKVVNNRYFYEPTHNNSVVYLDAKGHKGSLHGRIPAETVWPTLLEQQQQQSTQPQLLSPPFDSLQRPFAWVYTSWSEVISLYVAQLQPRPTHVVFNAGLWPNNFLYQPELTTDLKQALQAASMTGIWKTTTYGQHGKITYPSIPPTDQSMCQHLDACWNTSWTQFLLPQLYWDDKHFYEPVYRAMNEDLLELMGALPENYEKLDRSVLLQHSKE